ncbi:MULTISPECIES: flagellar basal body L-ring protein FlgH [unclassified Duganella]|uniref:flagellar basal body L-ring protein FlgH n=1 Tax=unclassified Duganella TaxID=2636909 RepID=UPI00088EB85E|nr:MULTISPECIES: flagellar basal body L-ring protein FlgH [unclassified Duganella]SDG02409.1 flagellar L-ring protein precursor FlgH [Duganella sp. OV458]SDJ02879.1 flagellar L-ring protein precursor FlgH [Duganella sp. OV510]
MKHAISLFIAAAVLSGCAATPSSIVSGPKSARPLTSEQLQAVPNNGAIYQASAFRPVFEDRRARHIGDVLTLVITERTSANKSGTASGNKSGSVSAALPKKLQSTFGNPLSVSSENTYTDGDAQTASNAFTGTMGITVVEVLSNGNLIVAGEKQVGMNKGTEYIRFSGMINPDSIATGNTVSSTAVADARVEYRTANSIDRAEVSSMASRFFQSLLPF